MTQNKKRYPVRTCVGCKRRALKDELIRIAVCDGKLVFDEDNRQTGRGAYICKHRDCFEKAIKRKGFFRTLKVKPDVVDTSDLQKDAESIFN